MEQFLKYDLKLGVTINLFVRERFHEFFLEIDQQNIQVELSVLAGDVIKVFKELGMDHFFDCLGALNEQKVSLCDFPMLL